MQQLSLRANALSVQQVRSAAAEPAPVGRAGIGWGGHFGWKALTSAKSSLSSGDVKVSMGWSDDSAVSACAEIAGQKLPKDEYQVRLKPGSFSARFSVFPISIRRNG